MPKIPQEVSPENVAAPVDCIPSIWLSRWESALAAGDYARAADCARQLELLGVRVRLAWTGRKVESEGAANVG